MWMNQDMLNSGKIACVMYESCNLDTLEPDLALYVCDMHVSVGT